MELSETAEDWYRPGPSIQEFHRSDARIRALIGGRGCIHPDTKIFDPTDGTYLTAKERAPLGPFHVAALTRAGPAIRQASAPFLKGVAPLWKVSLADGNVLHLEGQHRLLSSRGWLCVDDAKPGDLVASEQNLLDSISEFAPPELQLSVSSFLQKVVDSLVSCSVYFRLGGGLLLQTLKIALGVSPLPDDAPGHIHQTLHLDGPVCEAGGSHSCQHELLQPKTGLPPSCAPCLAGDEASSFAGAAGYSNQLAVFLWFLGLLPVAAQHRMYLVVSDIAARPLDDPALLVLACYRTIRWTRLSSKTLGEVSPYYDLQVPGEENYVAGGVLNHNSGKTTGDMVEAVRHCWHNPGAKVYVLRKFAEAQDQSTVDTLRQVFQNMGSAYADSGYSLFKEINGGKEWRLPSADSVKRFQKFMNLKSHTKGEIENWLNSEGEQYCSRIIFAGVPDASKRASRFRGYECSMLIFVEADELDIEDFRLGLATLRWKNAYGEEIKDLSCILDTNPPSPTHWIAKYEDETKDDPDVKFWHLRTAENAHNLPSGYVENLARSYAADPAGYTRMIEGQYADSFAGTPVFHQFSQTSAVMGLPWPRGAYLIRGWDFGTTSAVIFSAYWEQDGQEYWWDLKEVYLQDKDTEIQCQEVDSVTKEEFPFWNDREVCAGVLDYCDPAGDAKKSTGQDVKILRTYGFNPGWNTAIRGLQVSFAILNRLFSIRDKSGNPVYRIDKEGCPRLYLALSGGYRYPASGESGYGKGEPLKGPRFGNFDHPSDAARYAKMNALHLDRYVPEELKPLVGKLGKTTAVNRPRRYT